MRLIAFLFLILVLACAPGCSGANYSVGHVETVTLQPEHPDAGEKTRIYVDLYDPYMYPGVDGAGPRVTLQVTGGTVEGRDWSGQLNGSGSWQPQDGASIIVSPQGPMYWTLPSMPGTYKLTVGFDGREKIKRVEIK